MRYGFVIDHDRCIGCHACTVACKEEHSVPVGVFRTWVKYIEKGVFPDASRHFGVLRCNHCDNAPCIEICPTTALFRRGNGIVDFDADRCIGCKSCMQACPYDALYIDPDTHTAAKCNFCAHRVELNLEPSCVIVCPTQAIIAGDLDDGGSRISKIVGTQKTISRKPQKGTEPKLFYIGIDGDLLVPTRLLRPAAHLWAEKQPGENAPDEAHRYNPVAGRGDLSSAARAREVYDIAHPAPWGWRIAAYLWTKSIASGLLLVAAFLIGFGYDARMPALSTIPSAGALVFLALTAFLLVIDLKRPMRFFYLITKPNFGSWVVIGTYILILYGGLAMAWFLYSFITSSIPGSIVLLSASAAVGCACYTAFLFAQAKGRDFWQSPLLFWHLLVQSVVAGAASLRLIASATGTTGSLIPALDKITVLSLLLALMMMTIEVTIPPIGEDVRYATDLLIRGRLKFRFIIGAIGIGTMIPALILSTPLSPIFQEPAQIAACILVLAGLFMFEDLWVRAGQAPPLS